MHFMLQRESSIVSWCSGAANMAGSGVMLALARATQF
jgi:hypothetical protein